MDDMKMPRLNYWQRLYYIWGPVLIKWIMSATVSLGASAMILAHALMSDRAKMMDIMSDQSKVLEFASEVVMKYSTPIEGIAAVITIPMMLYLFSKDQKRRAYYGIFPKKKAPFFQYWMIALMFASSSIALNNLILIGNLNKFDELYETTNEALYAPGIGVQILCLCILVPIVEELVFRGVIYQRLREDSSYIIAMVYTAMIFGFLHGSVIQGIFGFIMGLLLAYVCERYASVCAGIFGHIVANLVTICATNYGFYDWEVHDIKIIGTITVICAMITAVSYLCMGRVKGEIEGAPYSS